MSQKHESFTLGTPNQPHPSVSALKLFDDLGLSTDPAQHADPKCTTCNGRGVLVLVEKDGRKQTTCGCSAKRYKKRRALVGQMLVDMRRRALKLVVLDETQQLDVVMPFVNELP